MKTPLQPMNCFLLAIILLVSSPVYAQMSNTAERSNTVNLYNIPLLEKRIQLLAAVKAHPQLYAETGTESGSIHIVGKADLSDQTVALLFEQLMAQLVTQANEMTKTELAEAAAQWKTQLTQTWVAYALGDQLNLRGDFCAESDPFCTGEIYSFPAGYNSGVAEPGPDYGCLSSQPNPVWYHMRILQAGDITIEMEGIKTNGEDMDIDFALWGPYNDPVSPCPDDLTSDCGDACPSNTANPNFYPSGNLHDCSFSYINVEHAHIDNGQVGQYYILLITNYSNQPGNITFQKTAGTGETDCSIVPPPIGSNSPVCVGETLELYADNVAGASYLWTGPNGFTSNQQNPVINNVTMANAGTYTLVITVGSSQSDPVQIQVEINPMPVPDFSFTEACLGEATVFTDLSTVNPPSGVITTWHWAFGDGTESNQQNPTHTYTAAGTYQVSLTTYTGQSECAQDVSKQVLVKMAATVDAGEDQSVFHDWIAELEGNATSGSGNYSFQWEPSNLIANPSNLQTNTLALTETTVFTLFVTDNSGGCVSEDDVVITVIGDEFVIAPTIDDSNICPGESTQLHANASGGSGNYTYSWTSNPAGFNSTLANPVVSPGISTTYLLSVFDGQNSLDDEVFVEVGPVSVANAGADQTITTGWTTQLEGSVSGGSGNYTVAWQPAEMLENSAILNPFTIALDNSTVFTLTITDNVSGCTTDDQVTIFTTGGLLNVTASANPAEICAGESSTLQATASGGSGSYTYLWTTVPPSSWQATTAQTTVVPDETTTYQIELNDGQNSVFEQITVLVGAVTTANAGPDITIPAGTTAVLQGSVSGGSGGYSVQWTPASMLNDPSLLQPTTLALENTQIFELNITDAASGCPSEDEMTVIVSGTVLSINPTATPDFVCPAHGSQLHANASGGSGSYTYSWTSNPSGFTSNEANPMVYPEVTSTYILSVSDGENQVDGSVAVEVGQLSVADAGNDKEIVYGFTAIVEGSVSGDQNYTFGWTPANFLDNPEALSPTTVPLEQSRSFNLQVTNTASGCITDDAVQVTVTGGPLGVEITADAAVICSGTQVQLNANTFGGSGNYTYSWSSSNSGFTSTLPNPVVEPIQSTTYSVVVSDGMNTAQDQHTITVNLSPVADAGPNKVINIGTFTTLEGSASGGTGNFVYLWTPADSLDNPQTGQYQPQPQTKILYATTNFTLLVTDLNGCSAISETAVITGGDQLGVFVEADQQAICLGETTQLHATAFGGGSQNYTYLWSTNNSGWQSTAANPEICPEATTLYTVAVSDGFLTVEETLSITVKLLPQVDITPSAYTPTDNTIFVCVRDSVWLDAGPGFSYLWMNGATAQRQKALTNGNWIDVQDWSVRVTDPLTGCVNNDSLIVFFDFNSCNIGLEELANTDQLRIFPNPGNGQFQLIVKNMEATVSLLVRAADGRNLIHRDQLKLSKSVTTIQLDLMIQPNGIYFLTITDGHHTISRKLIKSD
ncbi:MAG: PKD domain-containing protein [Bacteroidetes bacterium]|jgi:PKD repeat protein|nr:PKD domain-containing protein [Bacteroidota bacterium]